MPKWRVGPNGEGSWADSNGDGIIDGDEDFALFRTCYLAVTREGHPQDRPECHKFDFDNDGQVNTKDFSRFSTIISTGVDSFTEVQLEQVVEVLPPAPSPRFALWLLLAVAAMASFGGKKKPR